MNIRLSLGVALLVATATVVAFQRGVADAPMKAPQRQRSQYKVLTWHEVAQIERTLMIWSKDGKSQQRVTAGLNKLGDEGWNLFRVVEKNRGMGGEFFFKKSVGRPRWEYKFVGRHQVAQLADPKAPEPTSLTDEAQKKLSKAFNEGLNKLGDDGWELFAVEDEGDILVFKRAK